MATEVLMPKLGLTMTEGTIEEWKFKEGDSVSKGDILFSVATDKLTNDVECDTDGVLLSILCREGETMACKSVVAYIGSPGEKTEKTETAGEKEYFTDEYILATPCAKRLAREKGVELSSLKGTGPDGVIVMKDVENAKVRSAVKTSPMAAKLAAELGVDTSALSAEGRIMKADVLKAAYPEQGAAAEIVESNDLPAVKVDPLRRAIAANMLKSWSTSPAVTFTYAVDASGLKQLRASLRGAFEKKGFKLSYNHIIMKAAATALMEFPDINASFSDNMLTRHKHVNMGLAVAKGDGLIVPNVKSAELKSLAEISRETEELIAAVRGGSVGMESITGGTFTISSLGAFGVRSFTPIINQPELAILGVCDMVETPVVINGAVEVRPMMNICLTADHRVIDGVKGCKFMQRIKELLEDPYQLLI